MCFYFLLLGQTEKALAIETELENLCELDNITFNWHLTHLAMALVESSRNDLAEQFWNRILDRFATLENFLHLPDYRRIQSLVSNSLNELSVMFFNQGQQDKWLDNATIIRQRRWSLMTGSKYFDTQFARVTFIVADGDWSGLLL
jgi:hypothetical protein